MRPNPIPQELRCDHLFLLIGTNPVPNWVSASLLLKQGGTIYLVHSTGPKGTGAIAQKLGSFLVQKGLRQPIYVPINDESDATMAFHEVRKRVEKIFAGQIGLNYTGGRKVMAVHAYRSILQCMQKGLPVPVFSYLDARRCEMLFDPFEYDLAVQRFPVGLVDEVRLNLKQLFDLHGNSLKDSLDQKIICESVLDAIVETHKTQAGFLEWGDWRKAFQEKGPKDDIVLPNTDLLRPVSQALGEPNYHPAMTLKEVVQMRQEFKSVGELTQWLDGKWLEHHTLRCVKKSVTNQDDFGRNPEPKTGRRGFEADVMALCGYQLFLISNYAGYDKGTCKLKLFEAFVRTQQLGGDEARAALVCCSDNPASVENEVLQSWDVEGRVRVLGRAHLPNLAQELSKWFATGCK